MSKDMNIGQAIEAMKTGKLVRRAGWNGKGMYLYLEDSLEWPIRGGVYKGMHLYLEDSLEWPIRGGVYKGAVRKYEPVICMFTAQQRHQPGWLASQADLLASDWEIAE